MEEPTLGVLVVGGLLGSPPCTLFCPVTPLPVNQPEWDVPPVAVVFLVLMACGAVVSVIVGIYNHNTGTPYRVRGGGLHTPSGQKWAWVVGVQGSDGTRETRERSATWYEAKTWAERESSRYGTLCAWVSRATGRDDEVQIWTWRNGEIVNRRKLYLWQVEADPYLTERERAVIEEDARQLWEGE